MRVNRLVLRTEQAKKEFQKMQNLLLQLSFLSIILLKAIRYFKIESTF